MATRPYTVAGLFRPIVTKTFASLTGLAIARPLASFSSRCGAPRWTGTSGNWGRTVPQFPSIVAKRALIVAPTPTLADMEKPKPVPRKTLANENAEETGSRTSPDSSPIASTKPLPPIASVPPFFTHFPTWFHPYLYLIRLDKPAGTLLLYLPCTWSIAMAAYAHPEISLLYSSYMLVLFGVGALIMRGAGCIVNDLWDIEFDKKVERTRSRPLASGAISVPSAVAFLGANLLAGLGVLTQLNEFR